jgi:hypothetical protein
MVVAAVEPHHLVQENLVEQDLAQLSEELQSTSLVVVEVELTKVLDLVV